MPRKPRHASPLGWAFQSEVLGELITAEDLPELSCEELSALLQELRGRLNVLDSEMGHHVSRSESRGIAREICLAMVDLETFLSDFAGRVLRSMELCELRASKAWGRKTIRLRSHSSAISGVA